MYFAESKVQTERCADDSFKFDENGRKLSKWVENTVGKGKIARYEQFLLFPQCFQKGRQKASLCCNGRVKVCSGHAHF